MSAFEQRTPCATSRESIQAMLDGTLGPIRQAELEQHLEGCAECRALAAELQVIRDAAAALPVLDPPDRVWLQIAGRLRMEGRAAAPAASPVSSPRTHVAILALAAALVLAIGASLALLVQQFRAGDTAPTTAAAPAGDVDIASVEAEFRLAEQHYQNAIAKLEQAARIDQASADGATLDPQTAAMLQKNLTVLDRAIAESRDALRAEPQSVSARDSLFDALKRKVSLLQDTIALMNEMRKGNAAGAAQLAESPNKS